MAQNWAVTGRKRLVLRAIDALLAPLHLLGRIQPDRARADPSKILVLEFWQLGDAVLAEPFLRALRHRFPAAEISLLCKSPTRTLLTPSGLIDRFLIADIPWTAFERKYALERYGDADFLALVRRLRAEKFDVTLDARMDLRSNLLTWSIGAPRRIGFDAPGGCSLLTDRVPPPAGASHKVEDWLALLAPFGVIPEAVVTPPELVVPAEDSVRGLHSLHEAGFAAGAMLIAVHPSARQAVRRWPLERFGQLVRALASRPGVQVLLIQDPDGYAAELGDIPGVVTTRPSLSELPAQLQCCDLFIGNDSGPAHIAAAVGVPTLTIFGPQASAWYRPYGDGHRVVQLDNIACRPCFDHCTQSENFCITGISLARVLADVDEMLLLGGGSGAAAGAVDAVDLLPDSREIPA